MFLVAQKPSWREHVGWSVRVVLAVSLLVGVVGIGAQSALAAGTAYVADYADGTLTPIATATNVARRPFSAGVGPRAMAITSDGKTAYVVDEPVSTVSVIDLAAETVSHRIAVGTDPVAIALTPDGKNAYVAEAGSGQVQEINLTTNTVMHTIAVGADPNGIAMAPDGRTVYVSCGSCFAVVAISTATNAVTGTTPTGAPYWRPVGIAIAPNGSTAWVPQTFNGASVTPGSVFMFTLANITQTGGFCCFSAVPTAVAIGPDSLTAYVPTAAPLNLLAAFDVATGTMTSINLPGPLTNGLLVSPTAIAVTPDDKTIYVAMGGTPGMVVPVDVATHTVGTPITVGADPDAIAISNLGAVAPVLTYSNGKISWSAQSGVTDYIGAISTAPRGAAGRNTTYQDLGNVSSWTPTPQPGKTLYYGVASSGGAWSATEIAITWPVAPVLTYANGKISWSAQSGVTDYIGAISTAPRGAAGRTTTYQDLGNVSSWTPTPQPGKTLDYGVVSSGGAWSATEIAITWPVAPVLTYANGKISWSAQSGVTDYIGAISTAPRGAAGRTTTYQDLGNVSSWTPTPQPGKTLYYGVASSGGAWSATEIAITWPVARVLTYGNGSNTSLRPVRLTVLGVRCAGRTVRVTARISAGRGRVRAVALSGRQHVTLAASRPTRGIVTLSARVPVGRWRITVSVTPARGYRAPPGQTRTLRVPA